MINLTISAASSAALAPTANADTSPDAELLALGRKFDAALARFLAAEARSNAIDTTVEARLAELPWTGYLRNVAGEAIGEDAGARAALEEFYAADDALLAIIEAITAAPAHCLDGVAVKAKAATYVNERFGRSGEGLDERLMYSLTADVARVAGDNPDRPCPTAPGARVEQAATDLAA